LSCPVRLILGISGQAVPVWLITGTAYGVLPAIPWFLSNAFCGSHNLNPVVFGACTVIAYSLVLLIATLGDTESVSLLSWPSLIFQIDLS